MIRLLNLLTAAVSRLPRAGALALGRGFGFLFGRVLRYHRRDALDALARAFPERTPEERRRLADAMYRHLGLSGAELLWITPARMPEFMATRFAWDGREHFDRAKAAGRGGLVLTGHIGNWELLCRATSAAGFPMSAVIKPFRSRAMTAYVDWLRKAYGVGALPRTGAYRDILRALRANQLVGFVLDQNMTRAEGVFVDFFGRPACTTTGLAHLAANTGVPVIPVFIERVGEDRHVAHILPPLDPPPDREPETLRAATRQYTRIIEDYIRAHPEQWIWIHRRWRTQPVPEGEGGRSDGVLE